MESRGGVARDGAVFAFELLVNFMRGLVDEEQAAQQQDEIASADAVIKEAEERRGEPDHPRQATEQHHAGNDRQPQARLPRLGLLVRWQLARQDGDKDDVINAQYDLEQSQREQTDPDFGAGDPIHNGL